jgi:hypothetical protein
MATIRSLLHDQPPERIEPERPNERVAMPEPDGQSGKKARRNATSTSQKKRNVSNVGRFALRLLGHPHASKAVLFVGVVLILYLRPWFILGLLLLCALLTIGAFLILGYEGFWQRAMAAARRYAQHNPERAAKLHSKLDVFAMKWDAFLDRFPEGAVDSLYLPDFGDVQHADRRHDAALDRRFSQMHEGQG